MIMHFVEYVFPDLLMCHSYEEPISHRDPKKVNITDRCSGFRFFDIRVEIIDGETLMGEKKNFSNWYYDGDKMTFEEAIAICSDENKKILIESFKANGYTAVCRLKDKDYKDLPGYSSPHFIPLKEGDTTI